MPLVPYGETSLDTAKPAEPTKDYGIDYSEAPAREPSDSLWGASFRQNSSVGSFMASPERILAARDPSSWQAQEGYAPDWKALQSDPRYAEHIDQFTDVVNPAQEAALKAQIDMERKDRETIDAAGFWRGMGTGVITSLADPTTFLPGSVGLKAAKGGYSFVRGAVNVGLAGAGAMTAQEALLHNTQRTRTMEENAINIAAGTVLAGALGGVAGVLSRQAAKDAGGAFRNIHRVVDPLPDGVPVTRELSDLQARISAGERIAPREINETMMTALMRAQLGQPEMTPELAQRWAQIDRLATDLRNQTTRGPAEDLMTALRESFDGDGARLLDEGGVKIVQSVDDLPPPPAGVHPEDVRGMFDGKVAHIVADNVSPDEVRGVVLHEIGVHYGMQNMLGDDLFKRTVQDVVTRGQAGEGAFARALKAVPADTPQQHIAEEALAYLVENAPETGVVQSIISAVKTFVYRALGGRVVRLSENDYRQMAVSALRRWKPESRGPGDIRYAKANRDPTVLRPMSELVNAAKEMTSWKDWYERYQGDLRQQFGSDAELIQKMLSATSQATGVHGNVTLALKAYRQFLRGEPFDGYLPAVRGNLERIRNEIEIRGQKIGEYGKANAGQDGGIAVDRHIAELFFETKSPTAAQVASAQGMIRSIAAELGWEPRGVQAALWAYNIVRKGKEPQSYDTFLRAKAAEIQRIRAEHGRDLAGAAGDGAGRGGQADGLADGGAVGSASRGAQAAAADAGPDGPRYSRSKRVAKDIVEQDGGTNETVAPMAQLVDSSRIPTIRIKDLVGETLFPTIADRTVAGALYTGIDGSKLKIGIATLGGPRFPEMEGNVQAGVVWANRGKGVTTTKAERAKAGQLMAIVLGDRNMHQSNSTVANAMVSTMDAYVRDGRVPAENRPLIDAHLRKALKRDVPSIDDPAAFHAWADKLSFEDRKRVATVLGSKEIQAWGGPSFEKILDATREPEMGGMRWGDAVLIVKPDPTQPLVKLGEDGTMAHPDYPSGIRGTIVGKLDTPINYETLYADWLAKSEANARKRAVKEYPEKLAKALAEGKKPPKPPEQFKPNPRRSFELTKPAIKITPELAERLSAVETQYIKNARQARLLVDFASDRWRVSGKTKAQGGISPQGFVDALKESPASATLTPYTAKEVEQLIKSGEMRVFQLGEDGRVWFALKKGDPASEYGMKVDAFGPNEVTLHSVVNNEQGVPGVASPAIMLKAIKEGATALDAFAVKSAKHPDGFLVDLYRRYGYDVVDRVPFDPQYYDANKLADVKRFWASTGWKEGDGYPDVVFMKWRGSDADRATFSERYVGSGAEDVLDGRTRGNVAAAEANPPDARLTDAGRGTAADAGAPGGREGSAGAPLARGDGRLSASLRELKSLSDIGLRNLGLTRDDIAGMKYSRGAKRPTSEELASRIEALTQALERVNDPVAFEALTSRIASDLGAATVEGYSADELATAGKAATFWQNLTGGLNPLLRARTSPVASVMQTMQKLAEDTVFSNMHSTGRTLGPAAETLMRMNYRSAMFAFLDQKNTIFIEMHKAGQRLTRAEFNEAIADALRNGDVGANDFVSKAAAMTRREVLDKFADMARQTPKRGGGMLLEVPEGEVKGAESYLHRMYDHVALVDNEQGFRRMVADHFEPVLQQEYITSRDSARRSIARLEQEEADLNLDPQARVNEMQAIEARLKQMEGSNASEIQLLDDYWRLRRQATQAGERGNREGQQRLKEQAKAIMAGGGDTLKDFLKERGELRRRYRNISLNFAGMEEASQKIADRLNDLDDGMVRRMDRLVARGQKTVAEFARLSPEARDERLSQMRTQFAETAARSEKAAETLKAEAQKIAMEQIAAREKAAKAKAEGGMKGATADSIVTEADRKAMESNRKLAEKILERAAAERKRAEFLNSLARRIEEAEALDPEAQIAEVQRGIDALVRRSANAALEAGEKAQRLLDRASRLDPEIVKKRLEAIQGLKRDIERKFYDRWEVAKGGEGVDLNADAMPGLRAHAEEIADSIYRHVTGDSVRFGTVPDFAIPIASGPLKERVVPIPDNKLRPWLVNDIERVADHYARTMSAQIELTRKFGAPDLADQIGTVIDEYAKLRARVEEAPTGAAARAIIGQKPGMMDALSGWLSGQGKDRATKTRILRWLDERKRSDIKDIEAVRDMLLGTYRSDQRNAQWESVVSGLANYNYMRASGSMAISNLTDLYRPAMVYGLKRYMSDGLAPLFSNLSAMKAIKEEGQLAGGIAESFLHTVQQSWGELGDPYAMGTGVSNWMRKGSNIASKWNGMQLMQNFTQWMGSALSQKTILEGITTGKNERLLRYLGINATMQERIAQQFQAFGETQGGLMLANTKHWTDSEAVQVFRAALSKAVDRGSTVRSVADVPLWGNTATGRLILQFRSYALAANQRVLISGLQENQARFVSSVLAMTAIGAAAAALRSWRGGQDRWEKFQKAAQNPGYLIGEGLDSSGIFTIPFEMANTIEKLTQPTGHQINPIKTPLMKAFPGRSQQGSSTRFVSRDPVAAMLGPSAGIPMQAAQAIRGNGNAAAQMVPFYSMPGMREAAQWIGGDSPYVR